jgi:hypothetical protein
MGAVKWRRKGRRERFKAVGMLGEGSRPYIDTGEEQPTAVTTRIPSFLRHHFPLFSGSEREGGGRKSQFALPSSRRGALSIVASGLESISRVPNGENKVVHWPRRR